jgi:hypothetical protein
MSGLDFAITSPEQEVSADACNGDDGNDGGDGGDADVPMDASSSAP